MHPITSLANSASRIPRCSSTASPLKPGTCLDFHCIIQKQEGCKISPPSIECTLLGRLAYFETRQVASIVLRGLGSTTLAPVVPQSPEELRNPSLNTSEWISRPTCNPLETSSQSRLKLVERVPQIVPYHTLAQRRRLRSKTVPSGNVGNRSRITIPTNSQMGQNPGDGRSHCLLRGGPTQIKCGS